MLNALRLVEGFDAELFSERTGLDWGSVAREIGSLIDRGLMLSSGTRLAPSPQGLRFLNELLLTFVAQTRPKSAQMAGAFGLSTAS
jgi:oxygen-independent coproporphyrinogen-3 oxidase